MSHESLTAKLSKAATNMRRLCEFFAARREWKLPHDGEPAARALGEATLGVGEELRSMMALCGANPVGERVPDVESLGEGTHDSARLERFITFLRDLRVWFSAQSSPPTDSDGIAALREMEGHVACMSTIIGETLKRQPASAPAAPAASTAPPEPVEEPLDANPVEFEKRAPQLVLDDTESNPMVQEFQGRSELTPECERLADAYLAAWDLKLSYFNRKKLLERILRWITSAPDGQVLVIKMKTLEEPYEPYPSYVSREVLQQRQLPNEE
ncbi:MAG: hypothetical protein V2I67_01895 [Thermoanaerobaculales bacterium]|jgi:hypothetical protein|nr:hypothetical protein [Thermoanaerobaculales bacterium]